MLLWNELQNLLYSWKYRLHQPTEQMPIQPIKHGGGGSFALCVACVLLTLNRCTASSWTTWDVHCICSFLLLLHLRTVFRSGDMHKSNHHLWWPSLEHIGSYVGPDDHSASPSCTSLSLLLLVADWLILKLTDGQPQTCLQSQRQTELLV